MKIRHSVCSAIMALIMVFSANAANAAIEPADYVSIPLACNSLMYMSKGWNTFTNQYEQYIYGCNNLYTYIHKETMRTLIDSKGKLVSANSGVEYDFSNVLKDGHVMSAMITANAKLENNKATILYENSAKTLEVPEDNYDKIYFVATTRGAPYVSNAAAANVSNYKVEVAYSDETKDTRELTIYGYQTSNSQVVASPKLIMGTDTNVTSTSFNMFEYAIDVDASKTVKFVTFVGNNNGEGVAPTPISVFAVTGVKYYKSAIEKSIDALPEAKDISSTNISQVLPKLYDISDMISGYTEKGGNRADISNIEKFDEIASLFVKVEDCSYKTEKEYVTVELKFNKEIDTASFDAEVSGTDFSIENKKIEKSFETQGTNTIAKLKFKHYLHYGEELTLTVDKEATSKSDNFGMIENYKAKIIPESVFGISEFSVKNSSELPITSLAGMDGETVKVSATAKNGAILDNQDVLFIICLYSDKNELVDCKVSGKVYNKNESSPVECELKLPEDVNGDWNISLYTLDGINGMKLLGKTCWLKVVL